MQARGLLVAIVLLAPALAGCFAPPATVARAPSFQPYERHPVLVKMDGIEAREPQCAEGACSEYYFVRISGSENVTLVKGPDVLKECRTNTMVWLYDAYTTNQTVIYNQSRNPTLESPELYTLISEDFWGIAFSDRTAIEGCPTSNRLLPLSRTDSQPRTSYLGSYGSVDIRVYRGGNLAINGEHFPVLGEKLVFSYGKLRVIGNTTYFVQGGFEVANYGAWPASQLQPGVGTIKRPG